MYRAKPHHRRLWRSRSRPWLSMAPLARRPNPLSHPCWGAREVRLPDQQSELRRAHHEIGRPPPRLRYSVQGLATIKVEAHETSTAIPGSRCSPNQRRGAWRNRVTPSLRHELAKSLAIGEVARLAWRLPEISNEWANATSDNARRDCCAHNAPDQSIAKGEQDGNRQLGSSGVWYWRFSQQSSRQPAGCSGWLHPSHSARSPGLLGCVGKCGIRHRRDEAALA